MCNQLFNRPGKCSDWNYLARVVLLVTTTFFCATPLFANSTPSAAPNLQVRLIDKASQQALPGTHMTAYKVKGNRLRRVQRSTTDAQGLAVFELPGLSDGTVYRLQIRAFGRTKSYSKEVSSPGTFTFEVGKLSIEVIERVNQAPLANTSILLKELMANGRLRTRARGSTDGNGIVRFDPLGLGRGKSYVVMVRNPAGPGLKTSAPMSTEGDYRFIVGNEPLRVTLTNALSGQLLANTRVDAFEMQPNGRNRMRRRGFTDGAGVIFLDLDGLGNGKTFLLKSQAYNRLQAFSDAITQPGDYAFTVGNVPVILINGDTQKVMPGKQITVLRKFPDGRVESLRSGNADDTGTVHFTLSFSEAQQYVFSVQNPFGGRNSLYSDVIDSEGPLRFEINPDGDHGLDEVPPTIQILLPLEGGQVTPGGFRIEGVASDDKKLKSVTVQVTSPTSGLSTLIADYDDSNQSWAVVVPANLVAIGDTISITATAMDGGLNVTKASIQVLVAEDQLPPAIIITSHAPGDSVSETGFLLFGTATDDGSIKSLQITLDDPVLGRTVDQLLPVALGTGDWSLLVMPTQISLGETISIELTAVDGADKQTSVSIALTVAPVDVLVRHLINRITFGATPNLVREVINIGPDSYLQQQLDPNNIDDSVLEALVNGLEPSTPEELERYVLLHMVHSKRQLREVMTWFWDNHFNTDIDTKRGDFADNASYELAENRAFRTNALGNFRDLLGISSRSPAMLIFLDSVRNVKSDANENYIRELMELHTLRVDGGYGHSDIESGAELFTGRTVRNDAFFFDSRQHNGDEQVFLGTMIPAGGVEQAEQVLDILATHSSTASFMCEKLSRVLVTDMPSTDLISRCATVFLAASNDPDQIAQVVSMLLTSSEFTNNHRSKIKTPVEFVVGLVRNLQALTDANDLANPMALMGLRLFKNDRPTGWSETGDDWMNSNLLLERIKWVNRISSLSLAQRDGGDHIHSVVDVVGYFQDSGFVTVEGIVGFLLQMTMENDFTNLERTTAENILNEEVPFDINAPEAESKLRRLLGTVLSYPGYQFQ